MNGKMLGRIEAATFGLGGYQDACIGLSLTFAGKSWGCATFHGGWATERSEFTKWTEEERRNDLSDAVWKLKETLQEANKTHVAELVGVPVEVTFEGNLLKDWRVLTEVIR